MFDGCDRLIPVLCRCSSQALNPLLIRTKAHCMMITLCEVLNTVQWQYNTWHALVIHWLCLLSCALASLSTASLLARLRPDNSPLFCWPYQSTRGLVFRCSPSLHRTTFGASHLRGSSRRTLFHCLRNSFRDIFTLFLLFVVWRFGRAASGGGRPWSCLPWCGFALQTCGCNFLCA